MRPGIYRTLHLSARARQIVFRPVDAAWLAVTLALAVTLTCDSAWGETNWPAWGGPTGSNHSTETGLPVSWSDDDVVWKSALNGEGQSTPAVWGERIFLTTALDQGKQRVVMALDRRDGHLLWEQVAWTGEPEETHRMNGWASASCATNGEVVIAFFGRGGLHGYTLDGKHLWSRDLGQFAGPWGTAASPIFYRNLIIQNCDSESKESSVTAFDCRTGETVWNTPRDAVRGWSTPILIRANGREEMILNGEKGVRGYDPASGRELWFCKGFAGRGEPVPAFAHGKLFVVNGLAGDVYAVRPGGDGDVTETNRLWHTPRRGGRDLPSPVVIDKYMLAISMPGILFCYDCDTGRELWKERLDANYSSTPLVAGGRAYFQNDAGQTTVIEAGDAMKLVAKASLTSDGDELFRAALVPSAGQLLIRSTRYLYCVGGKSSSGAE
ncbi:MAG TPA: PQQ-binding-like beta-propeller repeat protein [Pirellulales bacterium]|nr:PQQ-binding-like beta-propeller repeat protein [Pirellulales bacterium]